MKALLLTIDFINDIVHPDGKISACADYVKTNQVIQHANTTMDIARSKNIPILAVKVGFSDNYIECPKHSPLFGKAPEFGALKLGSWGTEFHQDLKLKPQDKTLIKHRVSALYATDLATILTANQIDTVILTGVSTNMAIDTTARELHDRDYRVIIIEDACGAPSVDAHNSSLQTLARISTICTTNDLKNKLSD